MEPVIVYLTINLFLSIAHSRLKSDQAEEPREKLFNGRVKIVIGAITLVFCCSFPTLHALPLSPHVAAILRQTSSTDEFYGYKDMLGQYTRERVSGSGDKCPENMSITQVIPPEFNRSFSYRIPHQNIIADGVPCASGPGPFTAEYSFLENAIYIPGNLLQALRSHSITVELSTEFENMDRIANGSRAYFGYDANARVCGKYSFPPGTLVMFFASKSVIELSTLGFLNAGKKHMVIVVRNGTSELALCAYGAEHSYYRNRATPTQYINPSSSPSRTPSSSPTPSTTPTSSVTPSNTPTPSPTSSLTASTSPTSSKSSSPSGSISVTPSISSPTSPTTSVAVTASPSPGSSVSPSPSKPFTEQVFISLFSPRPSTPNKGNSTVEESPSTTNESNPTAIGITAVPTSRASASVKASIVPLPTGGNSSALGDITPSSSSCFESTSTVELRNGAKIGMSDLRIGDIVRVGREEYSPVFMFTHRASLKRYMFLLFELENGDVVKMTAGHVTYANGKMTPARGLRVGDTLEHVSGGCVRIVAIGSVDGIGLYNPHTVQGDVVVDGYRHSTYTETVLPSLAHSLLLFLRWLARYMGVSFLGFEQGIEDMPVGLQTVLNGKHIGYGVGCMVGLCSTTQFGSLLSA